MGTSAEKKIPRGRSGPVTPEKNGMKRRLVADRRTGRKRGGKEADRESYTRRKKHYLLALKRYVKAIH